MIIESLLHLLEITALRVVAYCLITYYAYGYAMGILGRVRAKTLLPHTLSYWLNTPPMLFSVLLLDYPREWLLTGKLERLKAIGSPWRQAFAAWVCESWLNPLNPGHCHPWP
jgi:hypothetical protein